MNPKLYFAVQFGKSFIVLLLAFVAFAVGNCGLGGTVLITFSTFIVSVFWYGIYCSLLGPPQQRERNPWVQGFVMIVHGAWAFAGVLLYVWLSHYGLDKSSSFSEGWRYWRQYLPYSIPAIVLVSVAVAWIATRQWLNADEEETSAIMDKDFWDRHHGRR